MVAVSNSLLISADCSVKSPHIIFIRGLCVMAHDRGQLCADLCTVECLCVRSDGTSYINERGLALETHVSPGQLHILDKVFAA